MGIFSQKSKFKEKLDELEKEIKSAGDGSTPETIGGWVQTLDEAMDYNVGERNAKDSAEISRIQGFTIQCTDLLMNLITLERVKEAAMNKAGEKIMDSIEEVAKKLDRVRSSPATTLVNEKLKTLRAEVLQEVGREAQALIKEVNTPENLSKGVQQILRSLKAAAKLMGKTPAPNIVQTIHRLLTALVQKMLPLVTLCLAKDSTMTLYKNALFSAEQIDKFALSSVMIFIPGQTWTPSALSVKKVHADFEKRKTAEQEAELEVAAQHALQCAQNELRRGQDELDKVTGFNAKVILEVLETLGPLWPKAKAHEDCQKKLQALCEAVEARLTSGLDERTPPPKIKALLQFAQVYEKHLAQLIKPEPDHQGLLAKLKAMLDEIRQKKEGEDAIRQATEQADGLLGMAEAELEKEANLNPVVVLQSLAKLKPVWEKGQNPELRSRLQKVVHSVESRVQESFVKALGEDAPGKPQALLKFAASCDDIQDQLEGSKKEESREPSKEEGDTAPESSPAETPSGSMSLSLSLSGDLSGDPESEAGLKRRLEETQVVHKGLKDAEEELSKEKGMNPAKVLGALKEIRVPWTHAHASQNEVLSGRLSEILKTISTRVLESFEGAVHEDNEKKQEALLAFASQLDTTSSGLQDEEGTLREQLMASDAGKEKRAAKISAQLLAAEEELAKDDTDISTVLEVLKGLQDPWQGIEVSQESTDRLEAVKTSLVNHIKEAYSSSDGDEEKQKEVKQFARSYDIMCMKISGLEVPDDEEEGDVEMLSPLVQEIMGKGEEEEALE